MRPKIRILQILLINVIQMNSKNFLLRLAGTIFGVVAVIHLLRVITGASVAIAGWELPMWVNVLGFVVTAILCGWMWWVSFSKENK